MLEELAKIRWNRLKHAYGNASDVPQHLLGLTSNKPGLRQESLGSLYSTIWHQGTVYQATIAAVPFLCELLREEMVKGKADILGLLQAIQSAHPQSAWQKDPLWCEKPSPLEIEQHAQCAKWARLARKAVAAEIDTYLSLLTDPSPVVRASASLLLVPCDKRSVDITEKLRQAIETESHAGVKTTFIYAWCRLSQNSQTAAASCAAKLRRLVENVQEKPAVRLTSALGLESFSKEQVETDLIRLLAWAYRKSGNVFDFLSRCGGSMDLLWQLSNRRQRRWDLYLELAKKPIPSLRKRIVPDLEQLCREHRGNFARVIPVFGELLSDPDAEFRATIAMTLSQMGTWTRFAQAPLVLALKDPHPPVAWWSAVALSKLRDPHVLPFVIENLAPERHTDLQERPQASVDPMTEFQRIQQESKHLLKLRLLLDALRSFGADGHRAVPQLRELLTTRQPPIQKMVCSALANFGEPSKSTVLLVGKLLKDPNVQAEAARALMHWGPAAAGSIPDLIEFLEDSSRADAWAKKSALTALGLMGKSAAIALPVLKNESMGPDFMTRCAAALAIWRIAPQTGGIIEALVHELREKTKPGWAIHGCVEVLTTLEALGPAAKPASPILKTLLDDSNGWARIHSARALWKIGTKLDLILPVLIDDLLCRPLGIAAGLHAAECLTEIGPPAAAAIPRLKQILARDDSLAHLGTGWVGSDEIYRSTVTKALRAIHPDTN